MRRKCSGSHGLMSFPKRTWAAASVTVRLGEKQTDWQIHGEICTKKRVETTKKDSQSRHVLSRFVICFGQSALCYCCILPICIGPDLLCQFPTWHTHMHAHAHAHAHARGVYFMPQSSGFPICSRSQWKRRMREAFFLSFSLPRQRGA